MIHKHRKFTIAAALLLTLSAAAIPVSAASPAAQCCPCWCSVPPEWEIPQLPETPDSPDTPDTGAISQLEQEAAALVNEIRAQYGLAPLTLDADLCAGARQKSEDMNRTGYFDHTSPTYGTAFDMMHAMGISYAAAAENIAMGYDTAEAVVAGWMASDSHRAAILSERYTATGIGYADGYWTQWFIG